MVAERSTTELVTRLSDGDGRAADVLMPLVYDELRRLAQHMLAREPANITLQATALVNEAYIKLVDQSRATWKDELHFLAVAAQAIRRVLVDHARRRLRAKRGGDQWKRILLDSNIVSPSAEGIEVLDLNDALEEFSREDERAAAIVELRYFGGMTTDQAAIFLNLSTATVERDWRFARAWLMHRLEDGAPDQKTNCHGK